MVSSPEPLKWDAVARRNVDLGQRMGKEGLCFTYDDAGDVLYVDIDEPQEALTEHMVGDVFVRVEPQTLRIVGFTIMAFQQDFLKNNKFMRKVFGSLPQEIKASGGTLRMSGRPAQVTAKALEAVVAGKG